MDSTVVKNLRTVRLLIKVLPSKSFFIIVKAYCPFCQSELSLEINTKAGTYNCPICVSSGPLAYLIEEADRQHRANNPDAQPLSVDLDVLECWKEDVYRPLLKPGGGEKQDRTNKIFSKQRMKDNRYKEPWGHQNKIEINNRKKRKKK